jgi:hypothetical protein
VQIKMLSSMPLTIDGVTTVDAEEGDELAVGDGVGADLVEAGHAESLESERKDDAPELENKDAGDADENKDDGDADESKPPKKPRARRRASK